MLDRGWVLPWRGRRRNRAVKSASLIASMALALTVVPMAAMPQVASAASKPNVPQAYAVTGVGTFKGTKVPIKDGTANNPYKPTKTKLPSAATGTASLSALTGAVSTAKAAVPGTPVWAQRTNTHSLTGPSGVSATVEPQSLASKLGISGVVFTVSGKGSAGKLRVGLDYSAFAQAYGGDFGSRLQLFTLRNCALTTPQLAKCQVRTPVAGAVNDAKGQSLSGLVSLPASTEQASALSAGSAASAATTASSSPVLAASAGSGEEGGATGQYAASTLSPDGSWTAGGSNGDFTYNYSITDPGSSSSLTPKVDLSYDSGAVDGKTAMTQAQSSWVGDGWQTSDSYIEQSFTSCADSPEGTAAPTLTADECYDGNILTISLNGSTTQLVKDDASGTWKLASDNGATVTHKTDTSNGSGTYDTDYWVVTERDGTSYYFGMNTLPGGKVTDSVDSERVYAAHSGDPCYNSTFTDSYCTMAYRWHLDYVTDVHGDAMAYYYHQDTNNYAADNGADNGSKSVSYVRDSYLKEIDYGFTTATGASGTIPDKIVFNTGNRCAVSSCPTLSSSLSAATAAADYPDIPTDLLCASDATCTAWSPSVFSTVNLTSITTEQYSTATSGYVTVDSYALAQDFPATGDSSSGTIWLKSITHTGSDTTAGGSSSSISEPSVSFSGIDLPNRFDTTNFPGLYRWRIGQVVSELGSVTGVTYEIPDACSTSTTPSSNATSCYPVYWTPVGYSSPVEDWFIKYAVQEVTVADTTGGATTEATSYSYQSPAWHYDDNEVVKAKYRTYGQFRGYQQVTTLTGDGQNDPQTKKVVSYYQGMNGDWLSSASTRSISLTDSQGGKRVDDNALAGQELESTTYLGNGGPVDDSTITSYWISAATATRARTGLPSLTANMTGAAETWKRQALTDGGETGTWRVTETDTSYDATTSDANFGLQTASYSHTVPVNAAYDQCTMTTYAAANTSENLIGLTQQQTTVSKACGGYTEGSTSSVPSGLNTLTSPSFTQDQIVSAEQSFYDDPAFSGTQPSAPTKGDVTETRKASGYASGAFTWQTQTKKTYDSYGRVLTSYDANGNKTTTAYTLSTANLTTGKSVTNPLGQATSETLDPERTLALTTTDANGVVTTTQYDALGRKTAIWFDSRYTATSTPAANYLYTYTESNSGVSGSTQQTMNEELGYNETIAILDSLGRTRETQADTPAGGRLVTDTFYDSRGLAKLKYNAWSDPNNTPTMALTGTTGNGENVPVPQNEIPNEDYLTYDGMGRQVEDQSEFKAQPCTTCGTTYTIYNGDATTVVPSAGGVTKTTKADPLGRTSASVEYSSAPTLSVPSNANTGVFSITGGTGLSTSYGFDGHGNQTTTTDPDGQVWTSVYNLLGQVTEKQDPTAGNSFMTYDANGNLLQTEDSRSDYVSYTYDALNRKVAQYASATVAQTAGASGNQMYAWVYDNSNNAVSGMKDAIGQLTTETTYSGGNTYTEQFTGFNVFGKSLGEKYTIPAAISGLAGTYSITHTYYPNTGLAYKDTYGAFGGLAAEQVEHGYEGLFDEPGGLDGTTSGASYGYEQSVSYDAYSRPTYAVLGSATHGEGSITDVYDAHSGDLTEQQIDHTVTTTATPVDDTVYNYDPSGNITNQTETRLGSSSDTETQCYQYNTLDELSQAWSATDQCAATPTSASHAQVANTLDTGSAYWESWTFNNEGNRTGQTQHAIGTATTDTATSYTYSSAQPNTLAGTSTTGGSTASTSYSYDTVGNTTGRTTPTDGTQTLGWDNAGQLTSVDTTAAGTGNTTGTTGYVYAADGTLLLQTTPTGTTIYLSTQEQATTNGGGSANATRYYQLAGGATVVRTNSTTGYSFEITDQHGTSQLYLDYTCQDATWRQFDPYGSIRGITPAWVDNRTFLHDVTDTATDLTNIGARWYDASLGRFVSLDPVLEASDPTQLGGYDYAGNDPVSGSDPTGEMLDGGGNGGGGADNGCDSQGSCGSIPSNGGGSGSESGSSTDDSTELNSPRLSNPSETLGQDAIDRFGDEHFVDVLKAIQQYYDGRGGWSYSDFTAVTAEVDVTIGDQVVPRTIVFVSQKGLPASLMKLLNYYNVPVYQARAGAKDDLRTHAEQAAADLRADEAEQTRSLGGIIERVKSAVVSNKVCSAFCSRNLSKFINGTDEGDQLHELEQQDAYNDTYGMVDGDTLTGPGRSYRLAIEQLESNGDSGGTAEAASEDDEGGE